MDDKKTKNWYEDSYKASGLSAQRLYPNEELLRFMGRNYFGASADKRKNIKILEIGSGSCSNLWMIDHEGFDTYGIDLSGNAIEIGKRLLNHWGAKEAKLQVASMTDIPFVDEYFDVVVDVFSSNCLNENDFINCLTEVNRVLKKGGRFFTYTPGKKSDAFLNHHPAKLIDGSTLSGIYRETSPFKGNYYPFRFVDPEEHQRLFEELGFMVEYSETIQRSYFSHQENFEHVVMEGVKV